MDPVTDFVNRRSEIEKFISMLKEPRANILFIFGPPGIGKSTLLKAFRSYCLEQDIPNALINLRTIISVSPDLLMELSRQMGIHNFPRFVDSINQFSSTLEKEINSPISESIELKPLEEQDKSLVVSGSAASYLVRGFSSKEQVRFMDVLLDAFFFDILHISDVKPIVILLDSFDEQSVENQSWIVHKFLRRVITKDNIIVVIASRIESELLQYSENYHAINLNPLSDEDIRDYIKAKFIINDEQVQQIIKMSEGSPLFLKLLLSSISK